MSSRNYIKQLQTSGTDFYGSGIIEKDFIDEKQMELDILGMTDDDDDDMSDKPKPVQTETIFGSFGNVGSMDSSKAERKPIREVKFSAVCTEPDMRTMTDDQLQIALSDSTHKEELILTDSDVETKVEHKIEPKPLASLARRTRILKAKPNIEILGGTDFSRSYAESDAYGLGKTDRVMDLDLDTDAGKPEPIMDSVIKAEVKNVERYFTRDAGILSSRWDDDWEREWGVGNPKSKKNDKRDVKNRNSVFASQVYHDTDADLDLDSPFHTYSQYMHLEPTKRGITFNLYDLLKEIMTIMVLHLYLGIYNPMFNVITIDGIITCAIFYLRYSIGKEDNFLNKIRLITVDRYIYYLLLFVAVHVTNYITWFQFPEAVRYLSSIMICPSIMGQVYHNKAYSKVRQLLYDGYNNLIKKIVCKQLSKILNLFIENVLKLEVRVKYTDLMKHYSGFEFVIINKFIVTFILAVIFNHIDKGGLRYPLMIYKNLYMKDRRYNIRDDRSYLTSIITDQRWEKFLDVYTLNRMIRMLVENDDKDTDLSTMINSNIKTLGFRFNRIMFCWTAMGLTHSLVGGILAYRLFIKQATTPIKYLLNIIIFCAMSFVTTEKILMLVFCEICFSIIESKIITDVTRDVVLSLYRGLCYLYNHTRAESIFFSILLSTLSAFGFGTISMLISIGINAILVLRFRSIDLNVSNTRIVIADHRQIENAQTEDALMDNTKPNTDSISTGASELSMSSLVSLFGKTDKLNGSDKAEKADKMNKVLTKYSIETLKIKNYSIHQNADILRYIGLAIKNNLLYKTIISRTTDKYDLYRMFVYYFCLMVFGYVSGFATWHIMLLPILIQNIVDILW